MTKQGNFKRVGSYHVRNWKEDTRTKADEEEEEIRYSPPHPDQKDAAAHMCQLILDRYGIQNAEIRTLGSKYLPCRQCEARGVEKFRHYFKITNCPVCGTYIPMPNIMHSRVDYADGKWLIVLGRTVTTKAAPLPYVKMHRPYYNMEKDGKGESWPMFANMCYTLTPIIYSVVSNWEMKDGVANWRAFNERKHNKWAGLLIKQAHPILLNGGFTGAVQARTSSKAPSNVSNQSDQLEARRTTIRSQVSGGFWASLPKPPPR